MIEFALEVCGAKALIEHVRAGQFVNHAGVQKQVACRPAGGAEHAKQAFMHVGALQQEGQIALTPQQRLYPVGQANGGLLGDKSFMHPLASACDQPAQPEARVFAQCQHPRVVTPDGNPVAEIRRQLVQQLIDGRYGSACLAAVAAFAFLFTAATEQRVKLLCDQFTVGVELAQEQASAWEIHCACDPAQVMILSGEHMGLLVVQVLNAVFYLTQKNISFFQRLCRFWRHQPRLDQAGQCVAGGPSSQFGKLPAPYHLHQLHNKLNFTNPAAREFDVVGPLRVSRAAFGGMFADLPVQCAQRVEHVVVQVAPEDEGHHHVAQILDGSVVVAAQTGHHAALEPGKPFPLAALHLQVDLQSAQGHSGWPRVAVWSQGQVHPKYQAVLGGVANQAKNCFDGLGKVLVV